MGDTCETVERREELLELAADLVAQYVSRNQLASNDVVDFFRSVYQTLAGSPGSGDRAVDAPAAASGGIEVSISDSVHHDYLVCLEDGQKLTMLKRYLRTHYNMSPDEYRRKWGLPPDYPMVAPAQSLKRSKNARQLGLGHTVRRRSKKG